jgi:acetyl esterase/lipase
MLAARIALSALKRPKGHSYGDDHPTQSADLHVPRGDGPFPVAVVLHGGHWRAKYGKLVTRPLCLDLVRRGWAAWNVEYRRIGRGQGGGWPATFDDVANAIDHLTTLGDPRLDLGDVHVVGHSAGGQLALWAGGRPHARVDLRSVVALAPVTNLEAAGESARSLVGGGPDDVPERFAIADPLRRAPLDVPVLIVHGTDDTTVPIRRSREYAVTASDRGGDVELIETDCRHRDPIHPSSPEWKTAATWLSRRSSRTSPSG